MKVCNGYYITNNCSLNMRDLLYIYWRGYIMLWYLDQIVISEVFDWYKRDSWNSASFNYLYLIYIKFWVCPIWLIYFIAITWLRPSKRYTFMYINMLTMTLHWFLFDNEKSCHYRDCKHVLCVRNFANSIFAFLPRLNKRSPRALHQNGISNARAIFINFFAILHRLSSNI